MQKRARIMQNKKEIEFLHFLKTKYEKRYIFLKNRFYLSKRHEKVIIWILKQNLISCIQLKFHAN
jgi:hypothetical protein